MPTLQKMLRAESARMHRKFYFEYELRALRTGFSYGLNVLK
jgi:hypothetical protein